MKAAVFYGEKDLRVEEVKIPTPKTGEALIKVHVCGICGTDVNIFEGDEGAAKSPSQTILGHEFSGEVIDLAKGVTRVKIGDRVSVDPNKSCKQCYYCQGGNGNFCNHMIGIGTTVNGGFAEYCVVPEEQLYIVSDSTTYEEAAMAEPVACCIHGIDMCDIKPGETVAVFGAGMIGLLMIQLARISGAAKIIAIEPIESKREEARKLGATFTIDPLSQNIKEILKKKNVERISTVIECVGKIDTLRQAIEIAGKKSIIMMFGLTEPNEELSIKPFELFKKEITIKSSFINPYTQKRAIDLIESGAVDVKSMIYDKISLEELPKLLEDPVARSKGKYLVSSY